MWICWTEVNEMNLVSIIQSEVSQKDKNKLTHAHTQTHTYIAMTDSCCYMAETKQYCKAITSDFKKRKITVKKGTCYTA